MTRRVTALPGALLLCAAFFMPAAPAPAAPAKEVVVLTSFPKELFEAYKQAFEQNAAFKDRPDVKSRMETEWDTAAKGGYAKARELADSAPGRIR